MTNKSFLVVTDTPSIKQFVFGTDTLAEVRGASALLDRLNRKETESRLRESVAGAGGRIETVYANGGSGQFLVQGCGLEDVRRAMVALSTYYRQQTSGEVRLAFGIAPLPQQGNYRDAVRTAHFHMRSQREMGGTCRCTSLLPFMMECQSASHLPASERSLWGNEGVKFLSHASQRKRHASRRTHEFGVWRDWMRHLADSGLWPREDRWDDLRSHDATAIGQRAGRRGGYVGLIYADGNAMGRLVQELDGVETCRAFSDIVDWGIREACYAALDLACKSQIAEVRDAQRTGEALSALPADILLLGGDDLLVLLPADRALSFALDVTERFERLTQKKMAALAGRAKAFFDQCVQGGGLTISCGVVIAKANYPFYLLLELSEALLENAKRAGSRVKQVDEHYSAPTYVDFHVVAGASSHELEHLRKDDYFTDTSHPRTLRPLPREQLLNLREGVDLLRQFPRSKLHDLLALSLTKSPVQAQRLVREVFSRCKKNERDALWQAVHRLCPLVHQFDFPWYKDADRHTLAIADLAEAFDLFPRKEDA